MTETIHEAPTSPAAGATDPTAARTVSTTTTAATGRTASGDAQDDTHAAAAGSERYLTFVLSGEVFALPILEVTEIIEYRSLTVVPMMPAFVRGVINLRGRVVPVVDLAARFGRGTTDVVRRTSIVIVEPNGQDGDGPDNGQDMGIMVDAVNKVIHLAPDDIEPAPAFGAGIRADFIRGMARYDGQFLIVLDAARVLCLDEMLHLGRAALSRQTLGAEVGV